MRLTRKNIVVASVLAASACGLVIGTFVPASVSAPRAGIPLEASVNPSALMMQAPLNLPVEQYDSH